MPSRQRYLSSTGQQHGATHASACNHACTHTHTHVRRPPLPRHPEPHHQLLYLCGLGQLLITNSSAQTLKIWVSRDHHQYQKPPKISKHYGIFQHKLEYRVGMSTLQHLRTHTFASSSTPVARSCLPFPAPFLFPPAVTSLWAPHLPPSASPSCHCSPTRKKHACFLRAQSLKSAQCAPAALQFQSKFAQHIAQEANGDGWRGRGWVGGLGKEHGPSPRAARRILRCPRHPPLDTQTHSVATTGPTSTEFGACGGARTGPAVGLQSQHPSIDTPRTHPGKLMF